MKRFIEGEDRNQSTLFPERLDDYIAEENPVRVIDVFVDELELGVLVQRMFVPADRVVALRIYCGYCILRRRILTELVFGGHDARQTEGTPDPFSQGLAELREVGGAVLVQRMFVPADRVIALGMVHYISTGLKVQCLPLLAFTRFEVIQTIIKHDCFFRDGKHLSISQFHDIEFNSAA